MAVSQGWSRWYDDAPTHPKFLAAGHKAGWLYVCGQAYASQHATDGLIPKAMVPRLSDVPSPMKVAEKLVEVGLWHDRGDHFEQHDFTAMQTTAAEREAKREVKASAGGQGNHQKWHVDRGIVKPGCRWCDAEHPPDSDRELIAPASPTRSHRGSPETETETETEKPQEEGARGSPTWDAVARRCNADLWASLSASRPQLVAAFADVEAAGWEPDRAAATLLARLETADSPAAVVLTKARTLAQTSPVQPSSHAAGCPDCHGSGLWWSDDGTEAVQCLHLRAKETA